MFNIYFAGDLFDHKHLAGNELLAKKIEALSNNKFKCMLPQKWEADFFYDPKVIRNKDLHAVMKADFMITNFDGVDLDSGTTVEYVIAKMLDIPTVILRSDFRGNMFKGGDDWNLMANYYPRSEKVRISSLAKYNEVGLEGLHQHIATETVGALEKLCKTKSLISSKEEAFYAYNHVVKMCGSDLEKIVTTEDVIKIIDQKIDKEIYTIQDAQTSKDCSLEL